MPSLTIKELVTQLQRGEIFDDTQPVTLYFADLDHAQKEPPPYRYTYLTIKNYQKLLELFPYARCCCLHIPCPPQECYGIPYDTQKIYESFTKTFLSEFLQALTANVFIHELHLDTIKSEEEIKALENFIKQNSTIQKIIVTKNEVVHYNPYGYQHSQQPSETAILHYILQYYIKL